MFSTCYVVLNSTGMSTIKVDRILVTLKAKVDRNVKFQCLQDFASSESHSRKEFQLLLLTEF